MDGSNRSCVVCVLIAVAALVFTGPAAAVDPILEGLVFELEAYRVTGGIPVYVSPDDAPAARSMTSVPKNPYDVGLSSVVLFTAGEGDFLGLQAARLSSPGNRLVVFEIAVHNRSLASKSLLVDDLVVHDAKGRRVRPVALAIGDSYLLAKTSAASRESMGKAAAPLRANRSAEILLAFAVPAESFPLRCEFMTDTSVDHDGLSEWALRSGAAEGDLNAKGTVQGESVPIEKRGGSLQTSDDVLFETAVALVADKHYRMEMNKYGGRTFDRTEIPEQLNGETTRRSIPLLARYGKEAAIAGRIRFLKPVAPRELTAPGSVEGVEVRVKTEFVAREGDVAVAAGRAHSFAFSFHTLE